MQDALQRPASVAQPPSDNPFSEVGLNPSSAIRPDQASAELFRTIHKKTSGMEDEYSTIKVSDPDEARGFSQVSGALLGAYKDPAFVSQEYSTIKVSDPRVSENNSPHRFPRERYLTQDIDALTLQDRGATLRGQGQGFQTLPLKASEDIPEIDKKEALLIVDHEPVEIGLVHKPRAVNKELGVGFFHNTSVSTDLAGRESIKNAKLQMDQSQKSTLSSTEPLPHFSLGKNSPASPATLAPPTTTLSDQRAETQPRIVSATELKPSQDTSNSLNPSPSPLPPLVPLDHGETFTASSSITSAAQIQSSSSTPSINLSALNGSAQIQSSSLQLVAESIIQARETGKGISVRLDPPELGRVYIDFIFETDRPVTVVIKAETLDANLQLRDRAEPFLNLLKDQGLENVTLKFEMSDNGQEQGQRSDDPSDSPEYEAVALSVVGESSSSAIDDPPSNKRQHYQTQIDLKL